jgi:hypothetical protein
MAKLELAFDILAKDHASQTLDKVGNAAQRTGEKVEHSSNRASKSFGLLGKTFATSSAGALGPLQELTDKMEVFQQATEQGGSKVGGHLLGLGLAATAAGSFIESLHSREQSALQQLQASIATTGHSYEDFAEDVEKAVKSGEHFGNQASITVDALNRLVVTTHNPEEAFKDLSVAIDIAATKHVPLAKAAEQVGLIFNGSTRAGKQFGLKLEDVKAATQGLTTAQHASLSATKAAKDAQTTYAEKLDLWNNSATHTRAQAFALRDAHTRMLEAQDKASAAAARLKTAQEKANDASEAGARNVAKLAAVVKGQGAAAADTFTGHLKELGAEIEDTLGAQGKLGGTLVTVGILGSGLGALIQSGVIGKIGGSLAGLATKFGILRDVEVTTSAQGAAAIEVNAAAGSAAMVAEGDVAIATAGRVRTAFLGLVASLPLLGVGAFPDLKKPTDPTGKLSKDQFQEFLGLQGKGANAGKLSTEDLKAIQTYLLAAKHLNGSLANILGDVTAILGSRGAFDAVLSPKANDADSDNPNVATRAQTAAAKALSGTKKTGAKAGTDSGDAYLKALLAQISSDQAASAARDAAVKNAQSMVDAVSGVFEKSKNRLQALVSESLSLRSSVTSALQGGSALTDVFGSSPDLNANGAFGRQNNFGRVRDFLQKRVALDRKFVLELRALIKQGLDPSLVAQIAQAGPDAGQRIAEAILSGGKGGIGQVNSLERQIASLANTTGKSVADQHYAKQIAEQRRTTEVLGEQLRRANNHLAAIQNQGSGGTTDTRTRDSLAGVG